MEKVTVILPAVPVTQNEYLRLHWAKRARVNKDWQHLVSLFFPKRESVVMTKAKMQIEQHRHGLQDPDNRVAACKPLIDAIVRAGFLKDDSPNWLELDVIERKVGRSEDKRTRVTIEYEGSE